MCFHFCNYIVETSYQTIFTLWVLKIHFFTTHLRSQFSHNFENQYLNITTKWPKMLLKGMPRRLMWSILRPRVLFGVLLMPHEKSSKKISLLNRRLLLEIWIPIMLYHTLKHTLSQLSYVVDCEWWTCFTRPIYRKIIIIYKTYCRPKLKLKKCWLGLNDPFPL